MSSKIFVLCGLMKMHKQMDWTKPSTVAYFVAETIIIKCMLTKICFKEIKQHSSQAIEERLQLAISCDQLKLLCLKPCN